MDNAVADLYSILRRRAPVLSPQIRPANSTVGARDPQEAILNLFANPADRRTAAKFLATCHKNADTQVGGRTSLVILCDLDVTGRTVTVVGLRFVTETEAVLHDAASFLTLQLSDGYDLEPLVSHFRMMNGYDATASDAVDQVFAAASSLQVLVDAMPAWATRVGAHVAPLSVGSAEALLGSLFEPKSEKITTKKRRTEA
jgi:hypothetical protein